MKGPRSAKATRGRPLPSATALPLALLPTHRRKKLSFVERTSSTRLRRPTVAMVHKRRTEAHPPRCYPLRHQTDRLTPRSISFSSISKLNSREYWMVLFSTFRQWSEARTLKILISYSQGVKTHDIRCSKGLDLRLISLICCWIRSKHGCFQQFFKFYTLWPLFSDIWLVFRYIQLISFNTEIR